jgi:hypothetical protein
LLQRSQAAKKEQEESGIVDNSTEKKLPTLNPSFKVTPRTSSQIKLRGVSTPTPGPALPESSRSGIRGPRKVLDGSPRDVVALGLDTRFTPRRSVKKLTIDDASLFLKTPAKENSPSKPRTVHFDAAQEEACSEIVDKTRPIAKKSPRGQDSEIPGVDEDPAQQYHMSPSLEELLRLSDEELRAVSNFEVSIPIYGTIQFLEPVDLLSACDNKRSNLSSMTGRIIVIEHRLVTVYPDEDLKPEVGKGLNVPAIITLVGCWAKDKRTGKIINDTTSPRFDKHIEKLRNMPETTFMGFHVPSGAWKFRVEHFSIYGLASDDESDENEDEEDSTTEILKVKDTGTFGIQSDESEGSDQDFEESPSSEESEEGESEIDGEELDASSEVASEESEEFSNGEVKDSSIAEKVTLPTSNEFSVSDDDKVPQVLERSMPTMQRLQTARNSQTLKAALFSTSPSSANKRTSDIKTELVTGFRPMFSKPADIVSSLSLASPKKYTKTGVQPQMNNNLDRFIDIRPNYQLNGIVSDMGAFMGPSFRPALSPLHSYFVPSHSVVGRMTKYPILQKNDVKSKKNLLFLETIRKYCTIVIENGMPKAQLDDVEFSTILQSIDEKVFSEKERNVWSLLSAAFDQVFIPQEALFSAEEAKDIRNSLREEKISKWLGEKVKKHLEPEYKSAAASERIFYHLLCRDISTAVKLAINNGDYRLATIMSQIGGSGSNTVLICNFESIVPNGVPGRGSMPAETLACLQAQVSKWKESTRWNDAISETYMAIWSLLAGDLGFWDDIVFRPSFDWVATFGVLYWYIKGGAMSLKESLELYEDTQAQGNIKKPIFNGFSDIEFMLLLVLAKRQGIHLEDVVPIQSYSKQAFDYQLGWSISVFLISKSILQFKNHQNFQNLCLDYMTELEALGLWRYAIFVAMFIDEQNAREIAIKSLLSRYYPINDSSGSFYKPTLEYDTRNESDSDLYVFLVDEICVPAEWIHETRVNYF